MQHAERLQHYAERPGSYASVSHTRRGIRPSAGEEYMHLLGADHTIGSLRVRFPETEPISVEALCWNTSLSRLHLDGTTLDIGPIVELLRYGRLRDLSLQRASIGDEGAIRIGEAGGTLKKLDLGGNTIGRDGAVALARRAESLSLQENEIGDDGAAALGDCLGKNVRKLRLDKNAIGDAGAIGLAPAVAELDVLQLSRNRIADAGAEELARRVRAKHLDLSRNYIGDRGGVALAAALERSRTLLSLGLEDNPFGDETVAAFARALGANQTVENLFIITPGRYASKETKRLLVANLEENRSLRKITVEVRDLRLRNRPYELEFQNGKSSPKELPPGHVRHLNGVDLHSDVLHQGERYVVKSIRMDGLFTLADPAGREVEAWRREIGPLFHP